MPLKFWDEAFVTATFLITFLPSKVLDFDTPTERLLHVTPNYDALQTFGCACCPNLRPYNKQKLAFHSKRCVFLGYSPIHKGVKCLDVSIGRIYISRDVVFNEIVFPFASLHPNAKALLKQQILLHPSSTYSTNEGVQNIDTDVQQVEEAPATNPTQNDAQTSSEIVFESQPENDETDTESNVDPPDDSPTSRDLEAHRLEADSPARTPSQSRVADHALTPPRPKEAHGVHTPPASGLLPPGVGTAADHATPLTSPSTTSPRSLSPSGLSPGARSAVDSPM
jgi:hypothetical protein